MRRLASSTRLFLIALPAALLLILAGLAAFRAQRTLASVAHSVQAKHQVSFTLLPFDSAAMAAANPGFEAVASPAGYTAGVSLGGELYLAGPGGLRIYAGDGTLRTTLRTGVELPAAPITSVVVGRLRGAREAQVLLATAGAGLLLLTPSHATPTLVQMLPGTAGAADMTALLPLGTGDLLLGTRHGGILVYSGTTLVPFRPTLPGLNAAALDVTALAATDAASYLVGTRNAGVLYVHGGTVVQATTADGFARQ